MIVTAKAVNCKSTVILLYLLLSVVPPRGMEQLDTKEEKKGRKKTSKELDEFIIRR